MKFVRFLAPLVLAAAIAATGCDKKEPVATEAPAETAKPQTTTPKPMTPIIPTAQVEDWCREHGVPESVCTRCNESLVASFQEKKDWCGSHNLPESQCFQCHPELKEKFAAAYKEKYGKEAPTGGAGH